MGSRARMLLASLLPSRKRRRRKKHPLQLLKRLLRKKMRERPRRRKRRRRRQPSKCHFFFLFLSSPAMFDSLETSRREQKHKKDKNTILNIPQTTVLYCIIVSTVQYTIAIVSASKTWDKII